MLIELSTLPTDIQQQLLHINQGEQLVITQKVKSLQLPRLTNHKALQN